MFVPQSILQRGKPAESKRKSVSSTFIYNFILNFIVLLLYSVNFTICCFAFICDGLKNRNVIKIG